MLLPDWLDDLEVSTNTERWFNNGEGGKLRWRGWERRNADPKVVAMAKDGGAYVYSELPPAARMRNYSSVTDRPEVAAAEFTYLEQEDIVEYHDEWVTRQPPGADVSEDAFVRVVNAIGLVPKPHTVDKWRPIVDFRRIGANSTMLPIPFKLPMPKDFLQYLHPEYVILRKDCMNGFFHLRLQEESRKLCGFHHPLTGRLGRYTSPPFGAAQSPYLFCTITIEGARLMVEEFKLLASSPDLLRGFLSRHPINPLMADLVPPGYSAHDLAVDLAKVFLDVYVDDFIAIGPPAGIAVANVVMEAVAAELGLEFKASKDAWGHTLDVLGVEMSCPALSISLPQEKADGYLLELQQFRAEFEGELTCPRKTLEQITGKLAFAAQLCRWGRSFTKELGRALHPPNYRGPPPDPCPLHPEVWSRDTRFWELTLASPTSRWRTRSQFASSPWAFAIQLEKHTVSQDASRVGMGGHDSGGERFARRWTSAELEHHICILELRAAVSHVSRRRFQLSGYRVVVLCDNAAAVSNIVHGAGKCDTTHALVMELASLAVTYNIDVTATHRSGIFMIATGTDELSRDPPDTPYDSAIEQYLQQALPPDPPPSRHAQVASCRTRRRTAPHCGSQPPTQTWRPRHHATPACTATTCLRRETVSLPGHGLQTWTCAATQQAQTSSPQHAVSCHTHQHTGTR